MRFSYSAVVLCIILFSVQLQANNVADKQSYLYVALKSQKLIALYKIDTESGDLTSLKSITVSGTPSNFTIDPTHKYLHAGIGSNKTVSSFSINENTGDLSLIGSSVSITGDPTFMTMDKKGRYLFLTYFSDNKTSIFSIDEKGFVKSGAVQVITNELNPHSILVDRSNKFLFVPCRTAESIQQYTFNEDSGQLSPNSPNKISSPDSTGPRHSALHPFLDMVYVSNEFGRSVSAYKLNTADGTLAKIQTTTMQPDDPKNLAIVGNQGGADIKITPDGKYLYATNRVPDKIVAFQIDQKTGMLTFIANYPTETLPRSFDIAPSGKFIYVGGNNSGKIASYKIDSSNGSLTYLKTLTAGKDLSWVATVELTNSNTVAANENIDNIPLEFSLSQNYPNPFNPQTTINYTISTPSNVSLKVFDMLGREIATLVDGYKQPGNYQSTFISSDASSSLRVASGVYFYTLRAGNYISTKKMILMQ